MFRNSSLRARPLALALLLALDPVAAQTASQQRNLVTAETASDVEAIGLEAFAKSQREPLVGVLIELEAPAFVASGAKVTGKALERAATAHHAKLARHQDDFIARANAAGIPLLLRTKTVPSGKGTMTIEYRLSYLMDAIVAYVPESKLGALSALDGVRAVTQPARTRFFLDNSVNYALGSQPTIAARRLAVYGATEELGPSGTNGNGPAATPVDGFEGQGINIGVVDSGLDYEHPMFGGTGVTTTVPQRPPAASGTNRKVTYWYNLGGASTLDDFGHGTHVASTAAGYLVDGDTPNVTPTGSTPFGPTPGGVRMHGVAPQATLQGWPVCNAAGNCTGDIELGIEDAVSPVILTGVGDGNSVPTTVAKPVSDIVNLSLGGGNDPAAASSRVSNNAVLATGAVVVAAAGNDGPGASTVGAPCVGAMVICTASVLDPGSTAGSDVLAAGEIAGDTCADADTCVTPAPDEELGAASDANLVALGERAGIRAFRIAGGGEIPEGSVSAHYVFVNRDQATIPAQVTGRIALLDGGTGTFAQIVNPVAALSPVAILLITDVTSATALTVVNGVPAYTISPADGAYLMEIMRTGDTTPAHGAVSRLPLRVKASISLEAYTGAVSDFSSRGPNAHANADYRTIKPDIAALGQGVLAATTPTGNSDGLLGMANPSGYTITSGTSMASPHVAGAAALVRQRVRTLGYDTTDLGDPDYRAKRFRASTMVRAMLSNTATDLRTGLGVEDPTGPNPSAYTIHDVGAGIIDIDAALRADAIMTAPTVVFDEEPNEYLPPETGDLPVPLDVNGNAIVPLPTASFGSVEVVGSVTPRVRDRLVTIEDVTGSGGGVYDLALVEDTGAHADIDVEFRSADGSTAINQLTVPADGSASFRVRVTATGDGTLSNGHLATWYVSATHAGSSKRLRMPFLYRAVTVPVPLLGLPDVPTITDAGAPNAAGCAVDADNSFGVAWGYTPDSPDELAPIGFRLQRGTFEQELFFDDTSEPLAGGANSLWTGAPTWSTSANPDTGDSAYFVPDAAEQADALTLDAPIAIPGNALGASLRILTRVDTESGFDFANIQVNADGGAYTTLGRFSGVASGTLDFDTSGFVGSAMGIQFLMTSDLAVPGPGWWVDTIGVYSNDYATIDNPAAATTTHGPVSLASPGTRRYRVAGRYTIDSSEVLGPYGTSACACVPLSSFPELPQDLLLRASFEDDGEIVGTNCQ